MRHVITRVAYERWTCACGASFYTVADADAHITAHPKPPLAPGPLVWADDDTAWWFPPVPATGSQEEKFREEARWGDDPDYPDPEESPE